jgi:hypothetical protein
VDGPIRRIVKLGPLRLTFGRWPFGKQHFAGWSLKFGRWSWGTR